MENLEVAGRAARAGAAVLRRYFERRPAAEFKGPWTRLGSAADIPFPLVTVHDGRGSFPRPGGLPTVPQRSITR